MGHFFSVNYVLVYAKRVQLVDCHVAFFLKYKKTTYFH